jgi:hypothetical protein
VIDPSFVGIVSFHGDNQIISVSRVASHGLKNLTYLSCTEWAKMNKQSKQ